MTTKQLIDHLDIDDTDRELLKGACDKRKGRLLSNPPADTRRAIAWYAIVGTLNPQRLSVPFLIFMTEDERQTYKRLDGIAMRYRLLFATVTGYRFTADYSPETRDRAIDYLLNPKPQRSSRSC